AGFGTDAVEPIGGAGVVKALHGADQGLRGHAAHVHAGPANRPIADQRDPCTSFGGGNGGGKSGRTSADHSEIVTALGSAAIFHIILSSIRALAPPERENGD